MKKIIFLLALVAASYIFLYYAFVEITDVSILKTHYPQVVFQGKEMPVGIRFEKHRPDTWISLSEISKAAMQAVMISEDAAFYQHNGYDLDQLVEAVKTDLRKRRFARGGSTITQQVAKNVFLGTDKTLWRKIRELILALNLEKNIGKRRILETYFNIAEWGEGIYGIGAASQFYFHKPASQLNAKEGAFLAMLLPSPKKYSTSFRKGELSPYARSTINTILRKLLHIERITQEEYNHFLKTPFDFEKSFASASDHDSSAEAEISDEQDDSSGYSQVPVISK